MWKVSEPGQSPYHGRQEGDGAIVHQAQGAEAEAEGETQGKLY